MAGTYCCECRATTDEADMCVFAAAALANAMAAGFAAVVTAAAAGAHDLFEVLQLWKSGQSRARNVVVSGVNGIGVAERRVGDFLAQLCVSSKLVAVPLGLGQP